MVFQERGKLGRFGRSRWGEHQFASRPDQKTPCWLPHSQSIWIWEKSVWNNSLLMGCWALDFAIQWNRKCVDVPFLFRQFQLSGWEIQESNKFDDMVQILNALRGGTGISEKKRFVVIASEAIRLSCDSMTQPCKEAHAQLDSWMQCRP